MAGHPWYEDGLRFTCSQCGDCCTGGPGYVWVDDEEIETIARHLGIDRETFEAKYVRNIGRGKSLGELDDSNWDCVFLDGQTRKCSVYEVRPRQCRTWPFWESNVESPETWERTCQVCPGSGRGEFVPLEVIQEKLAVIQI
jgi:hypothetical protein